MPSIVSSCFAEAMWGAPSPSASSSLSSGLKHYYGPTGQRNPVDLFDASMPTSMLPRKAPHGSIVSFSPSFIGPSLEQDGATMCSSVKPRRRRSSFSSKIDPSVPTTTNFLDQPTSALGAAQAGGKKVGKTLHNVEEAAEEGIESLLEHANNYFTYINYVAFGTSVAAGLFGLYALQRYQSLRKRLRLFHDQRSGAIE
ncbi:unnamed protein product [Amoebophrya sp. A25]|nr:unnamed protein product [Amoebophrya sp. A25]|eukprot:GSA25T00018900001.1